jgi:hypothetical protein
MVDALREASRALRPAGILIDARPDSRTLAKVEHDGRTVGTILTQAHECRDDRAADEAVRTAKRERLFRRVREGRFWHRIGFADRAALETYLRDHLRFRHHVRWGATARRRRAEWRDDPFSLVRAVRFAVLERL